MEIVADERLIYNSPEQAEEKIKKVMGDTALRQELLGNLKQQSDIFTASAFSKRVNEAINQFINN